ncbi:Gfo/Idh/MocA family oxidoreductase [Flagellimonas sp. HMM57]|uniref:Gfo/Idh/MocA family oxidoreductase n=1 Tax=unclassified Flagellimonas TaxID=2644544 RepID=UPI0013D0E88F|nr:MULTISPECIES: Gfo/Idh/MocA family oxidoreductase [unclassified Flagellimonas]UII77303.1 Gfo/Idh/MocA family oxidoreductase [Flagellimonas sp. HMM57]
MSSNRRDFIKKTAIGAVGVSLGSTSVNAMSAKSYSKIIGANDRIHVALQGLGRRYGAYISAIAAKENNIELEYLCDVMKSQRENAAAKVADKIKNKPKLENDIRKILDDKKVDAIFMATPDHWHAPGACMAMQAGKHVFLEKPCSHNPREGELVVAYQKKYKKMVQMGNQQRSSSESQEIIKEIHNGIIGDVYHAIAFYTSKRGRVPNQTKTNPPEGLDWELFQGPAPRREYTDNTWDYNWHWYGWDYGTAEMGNNATHELDIARWALQVEYPEHVSVNAGKYQYKDDGWEMYDTMEATFKFGKHKTIQWDGRSRNGYNKYGYGRGTIIYGSEGSVYIDRGGYKLFDLKGDLIKEKSAAGEEAGTALGGGGDMSTLHTVNFFDAIRGKAKLTSPIDEGAISQLLTHYANIAYRIDDAFEVDENTGRIFNREAMKLWSRTYEPGWEIQPV